MKIFISFFLNFIFVFCVYGQSYITIKVIDNESNKPISNARLLSQNKIFYTNDDGNVLVSSGTKVAIVSANSYEEVKVTFPLSVVKLKPIYKEIAEVIIQNIDTKKIIENVLINYDKNYFIKPTLYFGTYKSKSFIDENIHKLLIADMKIWALNNKFINDKNIDNYIQIGLNSIRFYKNRKTENNYPYSRKGIRDKNDINSFLSRIFMYNQLYLMSYYTKNLKINGRVINETGDIQEILFKSENMADDVLYYEGKMIYNKKDNAIAYLEVNQIQRKAIRKYKNTFDEDIETNTNNFIISYDFVKENGKYIISKINTNYLADLLYKSQSHSATVSEEFIFQTHLENKKGITNKIDVTKDIIDNISNNEVKENKTLLSSEEQNFIDEH